MFDFNHFRFSQTSLNSYVFCNRQFQLRYITPIHWPAEKNSQQLTIERLVRDGALFHRLAEQYFLGIPPEHIERQIDPLVDRSVFRYWKNFLSFAQNKFDLMDENQRFKPEYSILYKLAGFNLEAKVDLLHFNAMGNTFKIFDWKTSRAQSENDTLQTKIYLLALADHADNNNVPNQDPLSIDYWFAESPKEIIRVTKTREEIKLIQAQITEQLNQICLDTKFTPVNDAAKCGRCPYRTYCQTGLRAADYDPDADFDDEIDGWFGEPEWPKTNE